VRSFPGRLIIDNVFVAYECFHAIKKIRKGKKGFCAVKLAIHKAYDRVEWGFLGKIMLKMGFDQRWVKIIMTCVTSVCYRVRVNSDDSEIFMPTRKLHQGDPLSPYLFLLCIEGLTALLTKSEEQEELVGVKVEWFRSTENKFFPMKTKKNKPRSDLRDAKQ
jgi:hypothetical protein